MSIYLSFADAKREKRGEDEAGTSEGDDVEAVNLREELHGTTDDDGDENLGENDEEIKDSHIDTHFGGGDRGGEHCIGHGENGGPSYADSRKTNSQEKGEVVATRK